jgi:hypothetical protein
MAAWIVPVLLASSTALTIMGHKQNIANIKANMKNKNYLKKLENY